MPWQDDPIVAQSSGGWQDDPVVEPAQSEPAGRTPMQQRVREQGIGLRSVAEGASSLVTVPSDAIAGLLDYALAKSGVPFRFGSSSQAVSQLLTKAGVPEPENETEATANRIGRALSAAPASIAGGAQLAARGASAVTQGVGRTMAANPVLQTVGAGTGAASSEVAREAGAGPVGQAVAGIAGAVAPSVVSAGAASAVRGGFRGGEQGRQRVQQNIDTFRTAGTTPSVSQATEGRVARAAESGLARTPGAAGRLANVAEKQADEVGAALEQRAQQLAGRSVSAEQTGRKIEEAVRGSGGFVERFRQTQNQLYTQLDKQIAPQSAVKVDSTRKALQALTQPVAGAAETTKRLVNPKIAAIAEGLDLDAGQSGTIPYEALRQLRTRIGQELDNGLVSDVPEAQWKRLYGALSEDLKAAATTPQAMAAWRRADNYTKAGMARLEAIESVLNRNGGPEAIFSAATSGTREGASTLRSVMQSVDDEGQRMITATVLRRLGRAKAGVQGELGDRFSSETFLTNWNGLSTEAKRTLFNRYGDRFRAEMDQVARFAANLREGSQVFRNPSGTAQATAQVSAATAFVGSVVLGRLDAAAAVAAGVAGANLSARLMTNPRFVRWLAQSTRLPASAYTSAIGRLVQEARSSGDLDLARGAALLEEQQPAQARNDQDRRQQQ
jgi:hypothetical protein